MDHQPIRQKFAIGIAFLDVILVFITLIRHVPALQVAMEAPFPQILKISTLWSALAELLFYWAILVALYGLTSLWLPDLRFTLWVGAGMVVVAGMIYLLSGVIYYQNQGMGPPFQQGIFMFLLSLAVPFLVFKLLKRLQRNAKAQINWENP
jgi:hypothetical protein